MAKRIESPSSINTFKQCKRKYYYQYIAKLPTLSNIHQIRGNIAHSALEDFYSIDVSEFTAENYKQKFTLTMQGLFFNCWRRYTKELEQLSLNNDQKRFYFEETMLMLMNWVNHFNEDITGVMTSKNISLQEAFCSLTPLREQEFVSDNYCVRGFVDAIHHLEGEVHIIDYKTNTTFDLKDSIRLQLAIYSLLYFEKYGVVPSKVGIFFLRHKLKLMTVDEELFELAKREIELIHAHTSRSESVEDYPCCVGPLCKWGTGQCDFFEQCKPFEIHNAEKEQKEVTEQNLASEPLS